MAETTQGTQGQLLVQEGNLAFQNEDFRHTIALHLEALAFLDDPLEVADCYDHLGETFWRVGDIKEALSFSKKALQLKQLLVPDSASLAKTLSNLGCIFHERGQYEKALYLLDGALQIRNEIQPHSLDVAVTCTNLGLVMMEMGRVPEAIRLHQRARRIKEDLAPNTVTLARTYINMANVCSSVGQTGKAVKFLEKARDIVTQLEPIQHSVIATIDMNLGNVLKVAGDTAEAINCFLSAIYREEQVAPDSLVLADMLAELSLAYEDEGMKDEASKTHDQAVHIRQRKAPTTMEEQSNSVVNFLTNEREAD